MYDYFNNDKVIIDTRLGSDTTTTFVINLPIGFNNKNCYVSDIIICLNDDNWGSVKLNINWMSCSIVKDEFRYAIKDSGIFGKNMKLIIRKIN